MPESDGQAGLHCRVSGSHTEFQAQRVGLSPEHQVSAKVRPALVETPAEGSPLGHCCTCSYKHSRDREEPQQPVLMHGLVLRDWPLSTTEDGNGVTTPSAQGLPAAQPGCKEKTDHMGLSLAAHRTPTGESLPNPSSDALVLPSPRCWPT